MSYIDIKPYHNLTAPSVPMSDDSATEDLCSQVTASHNFTNMTEKSDGCPMAQNNFGQITIEMRWFKMLRLVFKTIYIGQVLLNF